MVITLPVTGKGTTTAELNGQIVDGMGVGCEAWFEYGGTSNYGMATPKSFGYVTGDTFLSVIDSLSPGSTIHFRAVALNKYGIGYGADMTFSTLSNQGPRTGLSIELNLLRGGND